MICLHCSYANLKDYAKYALAGFARCKYETRAATYTALGYERQCQNFNRAPDDFIAARINWYERKPA